MDRDPPVCDDEAGTVSIAVAGCPSGFAVAEAQSFRFVAIDTRFGLRDDCRFRCLDDARRAAGRLARPARPGGAHPAPPSDESVGGRLMRAPRPLRAAAAAALAAATALGTAVAP